MRRVVWAHSAVDDFADALTFIARSDPGAASSIADRIDDAVQRLEEHAVGRPGRISGTYEKPVRRTRYIIAYALEDEVLTILRIIHTARDWTEEGWPIEA
ncbi:type II toxin-antitoxin system RelE/ParE family toxin [Acuticoccus sediminis]|uniref:Type II toxin-antitoxin system RelE/ParE family toxin n=1 Tax=Acuticoccus sediminis TaxID=2184697 RepID=A0A8B2NJA9_9HYPH|nr:type II toxin-antitoxin system RelE/ParE family toxin [Acuticoccus sediminis]RAH95652.1 type II toxin-antitoxin system RelE/ParE family toxin [Acuticoccus sediminis]